MRPSLSTILLYIYVSIVCSDEETPTPTNEAGVFTTTSPSDAPSNDPTRRPTFAEVMTFAPSSKPSIEPSVEKSEIPTFAPIAPTFRPSIAPTLNPTNPLSTFIPTPIPTTPIPSSSPISLPTSFPSLCPTMGSTVLPTPIPTPPTFISRAPTIPMPTPIPTQLPTAIPLPEPTAYPTVTPAPSTLAPTLKPGLTLLPENVSISLIKPASEIATIYLVNLVDQPLRDLCISQWRRVSEGEIVPNFQVLLGDKVVASKGESGVPFSISNRVGQNSEDARLLIESSGLGRGVYELNLLAGELGGSDCPAESDPDFSVAARSLRVSLTVNTEADASATDFIIPSLTSNLSYPVLGSSYRGLRILARDLDGLIVLTEATDSFQVRLFKSGFPSAESSCVVTAPIASPRTAIDDNDKNIVYMYQVDCAIPLVEVAGDWNLTVSVKDTLAFNTPVQVLCRRGTYLDPSDELCKPCLRHALCEYNGLTLGTLQLEDGYWRQSESATNIYECDYEHVCRGPDPVIDPDTLLVTHAAYANELCRNRKHAGILCEVCRRYSRYDSVAHRCLACDRKDGKLVRFALILSGFVIAACLLGWLIQVCARKRGAQKDLSMFIRESVRYGGGDGTLRVLRKQQRLASTMSSDRTKSDSIDDEKEERRLRRNLLIQRLKLSLLHKAKILIAFTQIISAMPWVLQQISYPPLFESVASALTFFDLHVVRLLTLECVIRKWNFYRVLIVSTLLPIFLSGLIGLVTLLRLNSLYNRVLLARLARLRTGFISGSGSHDGSLGDGASTVTNTMDTSSTYRETTLVSATRDRARKIVSQAAFLWLLLTFLVFPATSTLIFQFFSCTTFRESQDSGESQRVLQVDYSVTCGSPSYRRMRGYALLAMLIYPIGIPLLYFVLLFQMRKRINPPVDEGHVLDHLPLAEEDKHFLITAGHELTFVKQLVKVHKRDHDHSIQHLSFIYEEYEPRALYFSVVDCCRKLCLSGILVFLYPGSTSQIGFATLFALFFAKVQTHVKPFLEDEDDLIAEVVMESLVIFFFLSLMLHVSNNCSDEDNGDTNATTKVFAAKVFGAVFVVMLLLLLLLAIYVVLLEVFGYETIATKFKGALSADKRKIVRAISHNADLPPGSFSSQGSAPRPSYEKSRNGPISPESKHSEDVDMSPTSGSDVVRPATFVDDSELLPVPSTPISSDESPFDEEDPGVIRVARM